MAWAPLEEGGEFFCRAFQRAQKSVEFPDGEMLDVGEKVSMFGAPNSLPPGLEIERIRFDSGQEVMGDSRKIRSAERCNGETKALKEVWEVFEGGEDQQQLEFLPEF